MRAAFKNSAGVVFFRFLVLSILLCFSFFLEIVVESLYFFVYIFTVSFCLCLYHQWFAILDHFLLYGIYYYKFYPIIGNILL